MRDIRNPFLNRPGYGCFGCSPNNEQGLRMSFAEEGEEIICSWEPDPRFAGYGGIIHGGIQATLHDEIAKRDCEEFHARVREFCARQVQEDTST